MKKFLELASLTDLYLFCFFSFIKSKINMKLKKIGIFIVQFDLGNSRYN